MHTKSATIAAMATASLFAGCRGEVSRKPPIHLVLDMDFQQKLKAQSESTFAGWKDGRGMREPVAGTLSRGGVPAGSQPGEYYTMPADQAFGAFDADGDGALDRVEAQSLPIHSFRIFSLADQNGDGGVDRSEYTAIAKIFVHKNKDGSWVTENPLPKTVQVLERGRQRFNINCAVCHGLTGRGGMVAKRWPVPLPDLVANQDADTRARLISLAPGEIFDTITMGKGTMPSYAQQVSVDDCWAIAHYLKALQGHFNN